MRISFYRMLNAAEIEITMAHVFAYKAGDLNFMAACYYCAVPDSAPNELCSWTNKCRGRAVPK